MSASHRPSLAHMPHLPCTPQCTIPLNNGLSMQSPAPLHRHLPCQPACRGAGREPLLLCCTCAAHCFCCQRPCFCCLPAGCCCCRCRRRLALLRRLAPALPLCWAARLRAAKYRAPRPSATPARPSALGCTPLGDRPTHRLERWLSRLGRKVLRQWDWLMSFTVR